MPYLLGAKIFRSARISQPPVRRKKKPKKYAVERKMKETDCISDDYYELLRNVA